MDPSRLSVDLDRRAARWGIGLGGVPVLTNAVTVLFLELVTSGLLSRARATSLVETVFGPVATTNVLVTLGVLLLAPAVAFVLTFPEERATGPVLAGFALGALVYGAGVAGVSWVGDFRPPVDGYHRIGTWLALLYVGTAALGALAGDTVGPLFRPPEDHDGDEGHPRW